MELSIGPHRIVVEQDVLTAYVSAPWRLEEIQRFLALCGETYSRLGSVYLVSIVGPGYDVPLESRKYIADWSRKHIVSGNLIAGAPLAMRVLVTLLARATQLIGSNNSAVTFVSDEEAAARAWIAEHRTQLRPAQLS